MSLDPTRSPERSAGHTTLARASGLPLEHFRAQHGALLLGRSERLTAPEHLGLHQIAPHAYGRL